MEELLNALKNIGISENEKFQESEILIDNLSFTKLRDKLYELGEIIFEDLDNHIYVVVFKSNLISNTVTIAIKWNPEKIFMCGFCKNALLKNKSVQKAFYKIEKTLSNPKQAPKKSYKKIIIIVICSLFILIVTIILFRITTLKDVTDCYNSAVEVYNQTVQEYNSLAIKGELKAISDIPESMEKINPQNTDLISMIGVALSNNNKQKIEKDTETVYQITKDNENAIALLKQIITPKQDTIEQKLKLVKNIKGIEEVTKDKNPNDMLNKDGGYYGCLYFTISLIDEKSVPGKSIVEKGTDTGGAIELFNNLDYAKKRCEYLASFDGTLLTTGSYVLVGTMVIRTSYKLDSNEQYLLTDNIIKAITSIE